MLLFIIFALFNAAPEHFAVTEDENASAGEDLIAVITFGYKTFLRLIPIILLLLPIAGCVMCIAEIFTSYVETFGDKAVLDTMEMFTKSSILGLFLTTGFIPLIACVLGAACGVVAFYCVPGVMETENLLVAIVLGAASGLSATGTNQVAKQLTKTTTKEDTENESA